MSAKFFLHFKEQKTSWQNVQAHHIYCTVSLCDEIRGCVQSRVLADATSARAPGRRTYNCRSHTMLVCQENQGPGLMSHECMAHVWLPAS